MNRIMNFALVAGLLAAHTSAFAASGYQQKLDALNARIDVRFSSILPFVKKVEGIDQLYRLVFESGNGVENYFDRKSGIVHAVYVHDCFRRDDQESIAARSLLREHTVLFDYLGSDTPTLLRELPTFEAELREIALLETELKGQMPNLILERTRSILDQTTTTNRSYLMNLLVLKNIFANRAYAAGLAGFTKVSVQDAADRNTPSIVQKYKYQVIENGRLTTKSAIMIRLSRSGVYQEKSQISLDLVRRFLELTLTLDFDMVDYFLVEETQINDMVGALLQFLTPERAATLKAKGIRRFFLTDRWEGMGEWVAGDKLTLGMKLEDMVKIYNLLYGN